MCDLPPPSSGPDFIFCWHLVGSVAEVQIADGIRPTNLKDPPQTIVGEGLHFLDG